MPSDDEAPAGPANDQQTAADPPPNPSGEELTPAQLRDQLSKVRHESAAYRTRLREATEQLQKFGPDADATLKARDATIRALTVDKTLLESFHKHGAAKPSLVRAYLADSGALAQFDPSAADFLEHVDTIVGETLENNPELRSSSAPQRSTIEYHGPGPSRQFTREEIAAMDPEEVVAMRRRGELGHLLGGGL